MGARSLAQEDPLEEGMATLENLAWFSLPGEPHGQRGLAGCSPWGCEESDRTEAAEHLVVCFFKKLH